jgi:hypothetical protein
MGDANEGEWCEESQEFATEDALPDERVQFDGAGSVQ